jgi:hypothetical protein
VVKQNKAAMKQQTFVIEQSKVVMTQNNVALEQKNSAWRQKREKNHRFAENILFEQKTGGSKPACTPGLGTRVL